MDRNLDCHWLSIPQIVIILNVLMDGHDLISPWIPAPNCHTEGRYLQFQNSLRSRRRMKWPNVISRESGVSCVIIVEPTSLYFCLFALDCCYILYFSFLLALLLLFRLPPTPLPSSLCVLIYEQAS